MSTNRFLTVASGGLRRLVTAISASAGVGDANKIVATNGDGKLDLSLMPNPPYLLFADIRGVGEHGGTTVSGAWTARPLTTELADTHNLGSLSASQVTLQPGTYRFRGVGVLYYCGTGSLRLWNVSDGVAPPQTSLSLVTVFTHDFTTICPETMGRMTIATAKTFQLEYCVQNGLATQGLGVANSFGTSECYATLEFWREP